MKWCLLLLLGVSVVTWADYFDRRVYPYIDDIRQRDIDAKAFLFDELGRTLRIQNEPEGAEDSDHPATAEEFMDYFETNARKLDRLDALVNWNYETDMTEENAAELVQVSTEVTKELKKLREESLKYDISRLTDRQKHWFKLLRLTADAKNETVLKEEISIISHLSSIYTKAKVCSPIDHKCYRGETGLVELFANLDTPPETLRWAWKAWRDATGAKMRDGYKRLVDAMNIGARDNGYGDIGEFWRLKDMGDQNLENMVLKLWKKLESAYKQLHAFVRRKLVAKYDKENIDPRGPIPAHLLGNLWGQQWQAIYKLVEPFPEASLVNPIAYMENYSIVDMVKLAEKFFSSIGLFNMTDKFWSKSIFVEPKDRIAQCHASAWDMHAENRDDFRIKMCATKTLRDLVTMHHEMGHVEYYMAYKNQPVLFDDSANAGFHEAVGDTFALSFIAPGHLERIGLIRKEDVAVSEDYRKKHSINFLMKIALERLAFLPYGLLVDLWRWRVFNGSISDKHYNKAWWDLRKEYQGIKPPVQRTEEDFDPGAKYHIPSNTPYIRYFVSFILQFQFYESMCEIKGHRGPLHTCDFYQSKEAGAKFKEMLELGKSVDWPEALSVLRGDREIDVSAILKYFKPLIDWLEIQNKYEEVGWE